MHAERAWQGTTCDIHVLVLCCAPFCSVGLFYFILTFNTANSQQLVPVMLSFRQVFTLQKQGRCQCMQVRAAEGHMAHCREL